MKNGKKEEKVTKKEKLTFTEISIALLKCFLAVVMVAECTYITAGIDQRLDSAGIISIFFLFMCFLYVNYVIFFKLNDKNKNTKIDHEDSISHIKKMVHSVQVKKIIMSKNMLFFVLTVIAGIIATFVMTIGACVLFEFFGDVFGGFYSDPSGWSGLGFAVEIFVTSGITSCVFAKWISLRTYNTGVKWGSILPIICMDGFVLFLPIYLIFAILFNDVLIPLFS